MPLHFDHSVAAGGKKRLSTSDRYRPKADVSWLAMHTLSLYRHLGFGRRTEEPGWGRLTLNVLFICGKNRLRSPTAEQLFADCSGVETASAGVNNDADVPVSQELLEWSDLIFVMEQNHRKKLTTRFASELANKRIICLNISDDYEYMAPALIKVLEARVRLYLPR